MDGKISSSEICSTSSSADSCSGGSQNAISAGHEGSIRVNDLKLRPGQQLCVLFWVPQSSPSYTLAAGQHRSTQVIDAAGESPTTRGIPCTPEYVCASSITTELYSSQTPAPLRMRIKIRIIPANSKSARQPAPELLAADPDLVSPSYVSARASTPKLAEQFVYRKLPDLHSMPLSDTKTTPVHRVLPFPQRIVQRVARSSLTTSMSPHSRFSRLSISATPPLDASTGRIRAFR